MASGDNVLDLTTTKKDEQRLKVPKSHFKESAQVREARIRQKYYKLQRLIPGVRLGESRTRTIDMAADYINQLLIELAIKNERIQQLEYECKRILLQEDEEPMNCVMKDSQ